MNKKRILSLILSVIMLMAVACPTGALADEELIELYDESDYYEEAYDESYDELFVEEEFIEEELNEEYLDNDIYEEVLVEEVVEAEDIQTVEVSDDEINVEAQDVDSTEEPDDDSSDEEAVQEDLQIAETFETGVLITKDPEDFTGPVGATATFKVETTGTGLTFEWQVKNTGDWKNTTMPGYNTNTLKVPILANRDGYKYRCIVKKGSSKSDTSKAATLHVGEAAALEITKDPEDFTGPLNTNATFTVEATGTNLTYRWQVKNTGDWKNTTMPGYNTDTLTVEILTNRNGNQYRCIVTSSTDSKTSEPATLRVGEPAAALAITKDPEDFTGPLDADATFKVEATGTGLTFKWQVNNSGTWKETTMPGNTTDTLTVKILENRNGNQYRCIVKDGAGNEKTSKAATLHVGQPEKTIDNVVYTKLTDTTACVKDYTGTAASVKVLAEVEIGGVNLTVTEIGAEAFMDDDTLTSVELPNSITKIGERAFKNCSKLSTMTTY